MKTVLIDMSQPLQMGIKSDPDMMMPHIEYIDHIQSVPQLLGAFPGLQADDLPNAEGWAIEKLEIYTHNGTHLDAPYHHHSTMDGGKRAISIDEVPLEWCYSKGVKLDFRHLPDGYLVTKNDIADELKRIGHVLRPLDIVVVNTSAGDWYGHDDYIHKGCGMGREATLFLLQNGVKVTGTDAWSWDVPFSITAERFKQTKDPSIIWEGHRASMDIGYCHMEKLGNLDKVPSTGFTISCFPFNIKGASAGFVRPVAIVPEA